MEFLRSLEFGLGGHGCVTDFTCTHHDMGSSLNYVPFLGPLYKSVAQNLGPQNPKTHIS